MNDDKFIKLSLMEKMGTG